MDRYSVTIPNWSEGKPLTVSGIEATSRTDAKAKVIAWLNRRAGYLYCTQLPPGTKCRKERR